METFPDEAYKSAFDLYKSLPPGLKTEADSIMKKYTPGKTPPDIMKKDLEALLNEHQKGGLEAKAQSNGGNTGYAVSSLLNGIGNVFSNPPFVQLGVIALLYLGLPPIP